MKKRYEEDDYLYSTARVRAMERSTIGNDGCERLAELRSTEELKRALEERGFDVREGIERALKLRIEETFAEVREMAVDVELFDVQRYPYDCHNIKSAIKSKLKGKECESRLIYRCGSVREEDVKELRVERYPRHMGVAVKESVEVYTRTRDAQKIDLMLDGACYKDMEEACERDNVEYIRELVRIRADLTNIQTVMRLSKGTEVKELKEVMVSGGSIELGSRENLPEILRGTEYRGIDLKKTEKSCDEYLMRYIGESRYKIRGIEPLMGYIASRECEVKNLRIIAAGKRTEATAVEIRERMRKNYV